MSGDEVTKEGGTLNVETTGDVRGTVRPLVFVVGAVFAAVTAVLVTQAEVVLSTVRIGYLSLPPVSLAVLIIALVINVILQRVAKRHELTRADLLIIYCMSLVSAMVSSHGVVQKLVPLLVIPSYYNNSGNNWHGLYDANLRPELVPYDTLRSGKQAVVDDYYSKLPAGAHMPIEAWITPILAWGILIALVLFAFLCLSAIVRKQWVDNEKLGFPLAQLPIEIAGALDSPGDSPSNGLFRQPLLWAGIALPTIVFSLKILHQLSPVIPDVTVQWNLTDYITMPPWSLAADGISFNLSFAAIGFFFLLPTDILLSIWFFFLVARLQIAGAAVYDIDLPAMPQFPPPLFIGYQTMGAYLVLAGYFLWSGRLHYRAVWNAAIGRVKLDDSDEILPYRVAVWGLIGSIVGAAIWLVWAGMSLWLALLELFVGIFVIGLVMARSTAESGMLMTETTFRPINFYQMFGSLHSLGPTNLTMLVFMDSLFLRDQRSLLLCGFIDSSRISEAVRVPRRNFTLALVLGVLTAFVVATFLNIYLPYQIGALKMDSWLEQGNSRWTFTDTSAFSGNQLGSTGTSGQMFGGLMIGLVVTVLLAVMRSMFFWWPLHPLGYALSGSWSTIQFWFPCLIAWAVKSLCLHFGGRPLFMKLRPIFLGFIIGEFGIAVLAVILNILFHIPPPAFPWN